MVTKAKKTVSKSRRAPRKAPAAKSGDRDSKPAELDFKKAKKGLDRFLRENSDWLREMAKR